MTPAGSRDRAETRANTRALGTKVTSRPVGSGAAEGHPRLFPWKTLIPAGDAAGTWRWQHRGLCRVQGAATIPAPGRPHIPPLEPLPCCPRLCIKRFTNVRVGLAQGPR